MCTCLSHARQIHQKFPIPLDKQVIAYWGFTCWPWETGLGQALSCRLQTNSCQELTMPKAESRRSLLSWETRCSQGTRNDGIWAVCIFQGHGAWKPLFSSRFLLPSLPFFPYKQAQAHRICFAELRWILCPLCAADFTATAPSSPWMPLCVPSAHPSSHSDISQHISQPWDAPGPGQVNTADRVIAVGVLWRERCLFPGLNVRSPRLISSNSFLSPNKVQPNQALRGLMKMCGI